MSNGLFIQEYNIYIYICKIVPIACKGMPSMRKGSYTQLKHFIISPNLFSLMV